MSEQAFENFINDTGCPQPSREEAEEWLALQKEAANPVEVFIAIMTVCGQAFGEIDKRWLKTQWDWAEQTDDVPAMLAEIGEDPPGECDDPTCECHQPENDNAPEATTSGGQMVLPPAFHALEMHTDTLTKDAMSGALTFFKLVLMTAKQLADKVFDNDAAKTTSAIQDAMSGLVHAAAKLVWVMREKRTFVEDKAHFMRIWEKALDTVLQAELEDQEPMGKA